jgi:1,4-dihydroxy-2-naphthoate octaprenyltransferase
MEGEGRLEYARGAVRMARPFVLLAGVLAYLVGLAYAWSRLGSIDAFAAGYGLLVLMTATMMGHYADEYADLDTDTLTRRTWFSGGSGVLPEGRLPPRFALHMALSMLLLTLLLAGVGWLWGMFTLDYLALLALSLFLGWSYSMPPFRLERRGWGELDNAILGGFSMVLAGYLPQAGDLDLDALMFCSPMFLVVLINLIPVHWSDREADRAVGKITLVVRLGQRASQLYLALIASLYLLTLWLWPEVLPTEAAVPMMLTLPIALWSYLRFKKSGDEWTGSLLMGTFFLAAIVGLSLASL